MSKNILVTGLILGKETEMCSCRNINFGWLFNRSSDLLWMDKVIVTRNEWAEINEVEDGDDERRQSLFKRAVKIIFERLEDEGLVQIVPDTIIGQSRAESILHTIEADLDLIKDLYTESDDERDPIMRMGEFEFCVPSLWTLYAAIELSRELNSSFSLKEDELAYLSELIPRKYNKEIRSGRNMAMDEVLSLYLPSVQLGNHYLGGYDDGTCNDCGKIFKCRKNCLPEIEKQINHILTIRQYDEVRMTCEIMDRICEKSAETGHVLTGDELWDDLQEEAKKTEKRIRRVLPKVKSWRKISTLVSIGLGAASFLNPIIGATAAIPAIAENLLSLEEDKLKKETSWVSFVNNPDSVLG